MSRKALIESIEHWHGLATNQPKKPEDWLGRTDCSLCRIYNDGISDTLCQGCPVKEFTGEENCHGTPYYDVIEFLHAVCCDIDKSIYYRDEAIAADPEFQALAKKEEDFLRSVLVKMGDDYE